MELNAGYKHTDVGDIPEDWHAVPLRQTCRAIYRGASPRPIGDPRWFSSSSDIGWVRIADVTRSRRYLRETTQRLSEDGISRSRFIPRGSLIMSICATVGRPIETAVDACIHDGFVVFENPCVDQGFLYHILCDLEPRWATKGQTGSQMNLNTDLIKITLIPLPPTEAEQRAIATALSDVDTLLEGLDRLIVKKRNLKQAVMQQLLEETTRLPGFANEWEDTSLGDLGSFLKGSGVTKAEAQSGALPCVRYGELYTKHDEYIKNVYSFISAEVARTAQELCKGDILFAGSGETKGEIGKCVAFVDEVEAYAGGDLVILRPRAADAMFLGFLLNMPYVKRQKASKGQGDAVVHISASALADVRVRLPADIEEQVAIATVLSDMDAEIGALEQRRAKTRDLKVAMMQELLIGKTRLVSQELVHA